MAVALRRMLDFVWHLCGSVPLVGVGSNADALDRVEVLLERQRKSVSERGPEHLVFDEPIWGSSFGPNWLAMVIYDRGRFWIEHGLHGRRLRYDLRSLHSMIFCLLGAFLAFFFGLAGGGFTIGLTIAAGVFGWLYGMNILLALARVPSAIGKAVTGG